MPTSLTTTAPRRSLPARLIIAALVLLTALLLPAAPSLAAGSPNVSLAIATPANVLYGSVGDVTFVATNPGAPSPDGYNLSYRAVLPTGVSYVPGSAGSAAGEPTILLGKPAAGQTTLLWKNLTDLAPGTAHTLAFEVNPSTSTFGVGGTYSIIGGAYIQNNPDLVPGFTVAGTADTSGSGTFTGSSEILSGTAANTSKITAISVAEDSDSAPADKLLRGLHQNQAIYTITVKNNAIGPTNSTIVNEYLPPGLEFLGCGGAGADHTTNAPTNAGSAQEYPGAGAITVPSVGGCSAPSVVDTNVADPIGPGPSALYTHVQWAIGDLAAGQTKTLTYAAAIPLRANTTSWTGTQPSNASGNQAANLDNNSGAEVASGAALTNYVSARGFFNGSILMSADAALTRTAADLTLAKHAQTAGLAQAGTTLWDLTLKTSEYRDASAATITDTLPDGLCPLENGVQLTHGAPSPADSAECLSSSETPTAPYATADEQADGTWLITWDSSSDPALAQLGPNTAHTITFPTRTRSSYQDAYEDSRPITTGDVADNNVSVAATARLVCANGVACPPGPAPGTQIGNGLAFATAAADTASDSLSAASPSLDAQIASTSANCATAAYVDTPIPSYRPGDRVCWKLHVDYPAGVSTEQATLTDFLPSSLTFDTTFGSAGDQTTGSDTIGGGVTLDSSTATAGANPAGGALRWTFPTPYVAGAKVFEHRVATTVGLPAGAAPGGVTATLFKAGNANASGTSIAARDASSYALSMPVVTLSKQVVAVNGRAQPGVSSQVVNGGDVVTYRVQLINASTDTPAQGVEAWDRLPAGVTCADVTASGSAISGSGVCTSNIIEWGASPAIGPDVPASGTVSLTYSVRVPTTIEPTQALTSSAGIRQFHTTTNLGGAFVYVPSSNIDPAQESSANVAPAISAATLTGAIPTITQTRTTSLNESAGALDFNTDQTATIGETIHHTIVATIPAGVTVRDFTVTDPVDSREALSPASLTQTTGPTGAPVSLTSSGNTITLAVGSSYTAATGADTVFTFTFDAVVTDTSTNFRNSGVLNAAATLSYTPPGQVAPAASTLSSGQIQTAIVEPQLSVDNQVSPGGAVSPGQLLTFTILARNGLASVSPAHETTLVDTVAAGLTPQNAAGNAIADGEYTQGGPGVGGLWSSAARTLTFTAPATINPGDADVHIFKATVDNPITAGQVLQNTVASTTTSLPGVTAGERTASSTRNTGYTDSKAITLNAQAATVSQVPALSTLTIAQQATFTLTVTIPANTTLYDVYVSDTLPDSMVFDAHGFDQCTAGCAVGSTPQIGQYSVVSGNANAQIVGWSLGDIAASASVRTISLPFTAHLLSTKRGSGSPGTPIVRGNSGAVPAVVSSNRTNRDPFPFNASQYPSLAYVFDDASSPSSAAFNVVEPALTINKTEAINNFTYVDGPLTAHDGDTLRYKITITNNGDQPAYDITIKDTPDARITNVTMSAGLSTTANALASGGHPWTAPGDYIGWSVGAAGLAPGASVSVDYTASMPPVSGLRQGATFVNTANLQDAYGLPGATRALHGGSGFVYRHYNVVNYPVLADSTTVKYDHPSLSIVKTTNGSGFPDVGPAQIDHPFTWRVLVTNTSLTAPATKLTVTDTLPKDWTFEPLSASFSSGGSIQPTIVTSAGGDQLTWATNIGLAAGASTTLTYQARPTLASVASIGTGATHPHINTANASTLDAAGVAADADGPFVPIGPDTSSAIISLPSISLTGTPDGGAAKAGAVVPFHVVVQNTGSVEATNVVVTDTLPANSTYTASSATASPATGFSETSANATTASFTVAQLAAGTSVDITVPINSDPAATSGTVLTNHADVSSAQTGLASADDATVTLTPSADLVAHKAALVGGASVAAATAGSTLQYAIGATNNGPSVAQTITLTDPLPATVNLVSAPAGCSPNVPTPGPVTVTCTFSGPTAVGASVSATIDTAVKSGVTSNADNTVTASTTTPDPTAGNNAASVTVAVGTLADLSIQKTIVGASPDPHAKHVVNGQTAQFSLQAHNAGPSDATGVQMADLLPAGLTFVSGSVAGGAACTALAQAVTCPIGALAAGADAAATVTVRGTVVGAQASAAAISSSVTVDPTPANDSDTATVTVDPATDLSLAQTAAATVAAGGSLTYTLTATNGGPNDATGVTITQVLPVGTTFASGDAGCTAAGVTVTCTVGVLVNGTSAVRHVTASVPVPLGATAITANASVAGAEADLVAGNNAASASTQVGPIADIQLTQSGPDSMTAGGTYTFTLSVRNDGPSDAPNVDVTDQLPAGVTGHRLTSARSGGAVGRAATPSQGTCSETSGVVLCHLGTLPAGASTLITVAVDVPETLGDSTLTNVASAQSSIPDPIANNEAASFSTRVLAKPPPPAPATPAQVAPPVIPANSANLSITKTADGVARANRELRYQITATNHGPAVAEDVVVDDALEAGVQYRAYSTSDGRCTFTGGTIHCKLGSLKVGDVTAIHVTVVPSRTGQLVNNATISGSTSDPITADNRAIAINTVSKLPPTKLLLVKTTTAKRVRGGQRVTYALKVTNVGKNPASNLQVCDRVPAQLAFTSTVGGTLNGSRLCFTQKLLAVGKRAVFKVHVRVAARARRGFFVGRAFADAENAATQNASVRSQIITDGKVKPSLVHGFTG